ncbi:MAG: hypothetical protein MZW92_68055 [Comamonadaceae bacterium]|nr:hypothetical protein [Comamonadaceae bacterium]
MISGDATDHQLDLHALAVDALARRVCQLAEHCPMLMLQNVLRAVGDRGHLSSARRRTPIAAWPTPSSRSRSPRTAPGSPSSGWRWRCSGRAPSSPACRRWNKAEVAAAVGAEAAAERWGAAVADLLSGQGEANRRARAAGSPPWGCPTAPCAAA